MVTLDRKSLFWFLGADCQPAEVNVHQLYDAVTPTTLVLTRAEDTEFCDSLDLIYGKRLKRMYLWDWHDEIWDKMMFSQDNPYPYTLNEVLRDVVSDRRDLAHLTTKPNPIEKMKREEQQRQLRRHEPQPYFDPKEMFDVPLLLPERKTRWNR